MKNIFKKNFMLISGILIFISIFSRFYLIINQIDVSSIGINISIDYLNLILIILGISLSITSIYYLPLLCIVKYNFDFKLNFKVQKYKVRYSSKNYSLNTSKQHIYKINNVILC